MPARVASLRPKLVPWFMRPHSIIVLAIHVKIFTLLVDAADVHGVNQIRQPIQPVVSQMEVRAGWVINVGQVAGPVVRDVLHPPGTARGGRVPPATPVCCGFVPQRALGNCARFRMSLWLIPPSCAWGRAHPSVSEGLSPKPNPAWQP